MAGWTTIDDFETGTIGVNWSANNSIVISSIDPIQGNYSVILDTSASDYGVGKDEIILNVKSVSRNANANKTVRYLIKYSDFSVADNNGISLIFFATDSNNYYRFRISLAKNTLDATIYLEKIVSGTLTVLASYNFNDSGATQVLGVEIKAETNLITAYTYTDLLFSVSTGVTISSSDITYTSGKVGIIMNSNLNSGGGVSEKCKVDYLQWYDASTTGTNMQINIGGVWKTIDSLQINISDVWKNVVSVQQNIGGVWKNVF